MGHISLVNESLRKKAFRFEDKLNRFTAKLKTAGAISEDICRDVYASGSGQGIIYGMSKFHKVNFSELLKMRPIIASYNNSSYNLA